MARRYFRLFDDMSMPERWLPGPILDPRGSELDVWLFTLGEPVSVEGPLSMLLVVAGKPLAFSEDSFGTPVVRADIATAIAKSAPDDVQLFPVHVDSQPDHYIILNATRTIRCIDDALCEEVEYWTEDDGLPDKVGQYKSIFGLRVDPSKIGDAKVFRTWGWPVLIVSEEIKDIMERLGATGAKFKEA
jgi:Immunity protein family (Imm11)